jgi:AraC-like DNA-binding protein
MSTPQEVVADEVFHRRLEEKPLTSTPSRSRRGTRARSDQGGEESTRHACRRVADHCDGLHDGSGRDLTEGDRTEELSVGRWRAPRSRRARRAPTVAGVTPEEIATLVHLRRARDLIDREHAHPLDVPSMARAAHMSPSHFSRKFRAAYGETPYTYLMTRRIERAKAHLRQGMSVTDTCMAVGCTSLGSFSSRFSEIVGETPSRYRSRDHRDLELVPSCVSMVVSRPRRSRVTV